MKYNVTLKGKVYEVEVERGEAILVNVADAVAPVAAMAAPAVAAPVAAAPVAAGATAAGDQIKAPMPGVILAVKVAAGESVTRGQILVLIEAMKMETEIVAPRDGKVAQVVVSKGNSVDTGAPLLVLA